MIFIISSSDREANLLVALCEQRSWPCQACASLSEFNKLADINEPRALVVRQRIRDGYSDDILAALRQFNTARSPRVIILAPADFPIRQEARQIALGADCVLRDPLRIEVLLEYLTKYRVLARNAELAANSLALRYEFAGVHVFPHEHRLARLKQSIHVAPQEIELLALLHRFPGKVVPYPVLYSELFRQRFGGDTANCRVLLGKATASFAQLGIDLRAFIEVIPKSGYLYSTTIQRPQLRVQRARRPRRCNKQ